MMFHENLEIVLVMVNRDIGLEYMETFAINEADKLQKIFTGVQK